MTDRAAQQRVLAEVGPMALVDLASALIRLPSFKTEETPVARFLAQFFRERDYRVELQEIEPGRFQTIATLPFYYKGTSDDGLYRSFAEVIDRVGESRLRVYLYHIPPVAQVPITLGLVEKLLKAHPAQTAGMKDSSGDWNNTKAFLDAFAKSGFDVFAGSETFLLRNMRNGGTGCISATANVHPGPIARLYDTWQAADADTQQARLDEIRGVFQKFPMIPALKAAIAHYGGDASWATVRPPLVDLTAEQAKTLVLYDRRNPNRAMWLGALVW